MLRMQGESDFLLDTGGPRHPDPMNAGFAWRHRIANRPPPSDQMEQVVQSESISTCSVMFEQDDVVDDAGWNFALRIQGDVCQADVFLTIDIYDLDNPVHPDGHIGWWRFPVEELGERPVGRLNMRENRIDITVAGVPSEDCWINDLPIFSGRRVINAVLRAKSDNSLISLDRIPAFANSRDHCEFRAGFSRDWQFPRFATPHFAPTPGTTVLIVSQSIRLHDAVGNLCLDLFRMLRQNGFAVRMYAEDFGLEFNDIVRPVQRLFSDAAQDDCLLYFYSIFDSHLEDILGLSVGRKIAYFHGITPPKLLEAFDPELSVLCERALGQLSELQRFDVLAANSNVTARDLVQSFGRGGWREEEVKVIVPRLMTKRAAQNRRVRAVGSSHARFLYVGRLKPHKRVERVLELFGAYREICRESECWIVGSHADPAYRAHLDWVEKSQLAIPPGRVHWLGQVSDDELQGIYRRASVYVNMSEHEGFCLPVLEAMLADLPVVSYPQPAVRNLLGGSGIAFFDNDFASMARDLRMLLDDRDQLADIVARQRERAAIVTREADGTAFWRLLELID
jgi:glycosyltransferase involved in cell wall biosynthesis